MKPNITKLVKHIHSKQWWRTVLPDDKSIKERGTFYASSYKEAEFYGRPIDTPFEVKIKNPIVGSNNTIEINLFGKVLSNENISIDERFKLDKKIKVAAQKIGFDSIVLLTEKAYTDFISTGKTPRSIELNIF